MKTEKPPSVPVIHQYPFLSIHSIEPDQTSWVSCNRGILCPIQTMDLDKMIHVPSRSISKHSVPITAPLFPHWVPSDFDFLVNYAFVSDKGIGYQSLHGMGSY